MQYLYKVFWNTKTHARDADHILRTWLWNSPEVRNTFFPQPVHLFSWVWWKNEINASYLVGAPGYNYEWRCIDIGSIDPIKELDEVPRGFFLTLLKGTERMLKPGTLTHPVVKESGPEVPYSMRVHANLNCGPKDRIFEWDCLRVFRPVSEDKVFVPFSFSMHDVVSFLGLKRGQFLITM